MDYAKHFQFENKKLLVETSQLAFLFPKLLLKRIVVLLTQLHFGTSFGFNTPSPLLFLHERHNCKICTQAVLPFAPCLCGSHAIVTSIFP
jgi:hypothetical protein